MPRYQYRCTACEDLSTINHLSSEILTACPRCKAPTGLVKLLTRFNTAPKRPVRQRVGQITEEFIEDARIDLQQQKEELEI